HRTPGVTGLHHPSHIVPTLMTVGAAVLACVRIVARTRKAPRRAGQSGAGAGSGGVLGLARRWAWGNDRASAQVGRRGGRMTKVSMTIDGVRYDDEVEPRMLLVHYLREVAGRTGTPIGCDTSNCGACTVLLNGLSAKSC